MLLSKVGGIQGNCLIELLLSHISTVNKTKHTDRYIDGFFCGVSCMRLGASSDEQLWPGLEGPQVE